MKRKMWSIFQWISIGGENMYSFETRVRYSELAEDRSASLVSIINYFQDCCTFESEDGEIGLDWLAEHDTAWMLTGWQIHIIRSPRYCERVKVTTWACGFKYFVGKRSFTITTLEGEVLVYAMSDWAYMNVKKQLPEKNVPQKELDVYGMAVPIEERFEEFGIKEFVEADQDRTVLKGKIQIPDEKDPDVTVEDSLDMNAVTPILVTADNLDTNHHVNNAQYVALAKSVIPEEIDVRHFRAEIKKQSVLGDVIYPVLYREKSRLVVVLNDENRTPKLIAEFHI